jgi:hypothetical protein
MFKVMLDAGGPAAVVTVIVGGESKLSLPVSAAPSPSPPLPQPQAVPPPRAVRSLSMDYQRADSTPLRSPSPERAASQVVAVPAAPLCQPPRARINTSRNLILHRGTAAATRIQDGELYVHKNYEGLLSMCYNDTELLGYGPEDNYVCFNKRDILWARWLRFHIKHLRFLL